MRGTSVCVPGRARNGIYTRARPLLNRVQLNRTKSDHDHKRIGNNNSARQEETMQRTTPPFRADHVGSLLRTAALKEARAKRADGTITAAELKAVEDREIEKVIKKQEDVGLKLATDGEFRRSWWHFDFFRGLDGVTFYSTDHGIQFAGVQTKAEGIKITGKIGFSGHPMLEHFKFLKAHTRVTPKMTIPAPSTFHFRQGRASISKDVYPDLDAFFDDVAKAWRGAIRAFYDAGCRYLQLDDTAWAMICDPNERAQSRVARRRSRYAAAALCAAHAASRSKASRPTWRSPCIPAAAISARPSSRRAATNSSPSSCSATPISTAISSNTTASAPAASSRCGIFPKGKKQLVLGLVTSKSGKLEKKDDIKRRIDEATKYVALDQLCLSPQCGFASTEEGNVLAEDEQWAKLRMIVEIADEVWG